MTKAIPMSSQREMRKKGIGNWGKEHHFYIVAKNLAEFCLCHRIW
jgi:hypothetical protein